jgi:hydrogenase expression/formation protein HypC
MCLGIPGRVLEVTRERELLTGKVDFGGICRSVCLEHVPETAPGDYVLVHVGFALARIDEAEAKRIFELLEGTEELDDLERMPE